MISQTTDSTFDKDVLDSNIPILVDFWAPNCMPCKVVGFLINKVSLKIKDKAKIYKINVKENPGIAKKYNITH